MDLFTHLHRSKDLQRKQILNPEEETAVMHHEATNEMRNVVLILTNPPAESRASIAACVAASQQISREDLQYQTLH